MFGGTEVVPAVTAVHEAPVAPPLTELLQGQRLAQVRGAESAGTLPHAGLDEETIVVPERLVGDHRRHRVLVTRNGRLEVHTI